MKKVISILLSIIIISSFFSLTILGEGEKSYRKYELGKYMTPKKQLYKPLSQFKIKTEDGREVISVLNKSAESDDGIGPPVEITVRLGEKITIEDMSEGRSDNIDKYDFQVYCLNNGAKSSYKVYDKLPEQWEMTEEGVWDFYLCVRGDTPSSKTRGWENWSDNGTHRTWGKITIGSQKLEMWWYFSQIRVNVVDEPIEPIEFTVYHYENGTENEVYREDIITDPTVTEVYPKNGKGLDGNEWICTLGNGPQPVTIVDDGEYIFYYTKKDTGTGGGQSTGTDGDKPTGSETGGELILVKDPLVKANCRIPGRTKIKKNAGGYHPDGMPLFRGDNFKPTGSIKNQNSRDTFTEYSMTLKDKPNKNFRQINYKKDECIITSGQTHYDNFTKKIDNNDRYGNVYVLTVEAKQRIIVPTPPPKPGPKPTKPSKPDRDDYDSSSEYRDDLDDYYDELEDYYDRLAAWYIKKEKWDAYVEKWGEPIDGYGEPDSGYVQIYKKFNGRDIWFSGYYGWKKGKGEDLNYVMPNVEKNIEDMDGGLKPGVITK